MIDDDIEAAADALAERWGVSKETTDEAKCIEKSMGSRKGRSKIVRAEIEAVDNEAFDLGAMYPKKPPKRFFLYAYDEAGIRRQLFNTTNAKLARDEVLKLMQANIPVTEYKPKR